MSKRRHFDDYSFKAAESWRHRKEEGHKHNVQLEAYRHKNPSAEAQQWWDGSLLYSDLPNRFSLKTNADSLKKGQSPTQCGLGGNAESGSNSWKCLDRAVTPEGTVMELMCYGEELAIFIDGIELMASGQHGSEELMAYLCALLHNDWHNMSNGKLDRLVEQAFSESWQEDKLETNDASLKVLIGGLGLGYTLKAALKAFPKSNRITAAELMNCVAEWNRGVLGKLAGFPLRDSRADLFIGDVREAICSQNWDIIMLDVDNGPEPITQMANHTLYSETGLKEIGEHLDTGGILAVWSVNHDRNFIGRLQHLGFTCRAVTVPSVLGTSNCDRHTIFLAYQ
ncbi:MAG: hypothetical protein ACI38Q_03310 [Candidatus Bruticola sp.]